MQKSQILATHRASVLQRVNDKAVVLAIQDTTDLDFSTLHKTTGLGFTCQSPKQGIKVHSCFAVAGDGEPLGLLHQQTWARAQRTGKRAERNKKGTAQKETQRWLDTLTAAQQGVDDSVCLVHVADREADIYDLLVQPRAAHSELLIRARHNRKVQHVSDRRSRELDYLISTLEQAPVMGQQTIEIERNPERPARSATLTVRGMQVTMEIPRQHLQAQACHPVTLNVLLVEEVNPVDEGPPIRWLLLTSLPIESFEQAWQCVQWYSLRWLIERFHYTLKSGCRIESLQLQTAERLVKALATYSILAWRLMWLRHSARLRPEASCQSILEPAEWRLLRRKFEPKNRSQKPPTLKQAVRWIAQLGGFLARKGDGEPGLKTLWRGIGVLFHLLEGAQLTAKP